MQFQENGSLPEGFYEVDILTFRDNFVKLFPASTTRADIFHGFKKYLSQLYSLGILFGVIVDGSFVTNKPDPGDIDITVVFKANVYNALSGNDLLAANKLLNEKYAAEIKKLYHVHNVWNVPFFEHPTPHQKETMAKNFRNALEFWGCGRDNIQKGIVYIQLNSDWANGLEALLS